MQEYEKTGIPLFFITGVRGMMVLVTGTISGGAFSETFFFYAFRNLRDSTFASIAVPNDVCTPSTAKECIVQSRGKDPTKTSSACAD